MWRSLRAFHLSTDYKSIPFTLLFTYSCVDHGLIQPSFRTIPGMLPAQVSSSYILSAFGIMILDGART